MQNLVARLYNEIECGNLTAEQVLDCCLEFMTDDQVRDMVEDNALLDIDHLDSIDESMDGDFDTGMASAGFGTNEDYGDYSEDY